MTFKLLHSISFFIFSLSTAGQLTVKDPAICHDSDGYLRCFNDGTFKLLFAEGNFNQFSTSDATLTYSDISKTFTFLADTFSSTGYKDTIHIKLLEQSILLTKGTSTLKITSLQEIPSSLENFFIETYTSDDHARGLTFRTGNKVAKIEVWPFKKQWEWNLMLRENEKKLTVTYNKFRGNRIEHLIIQDDSLRYGVTIATTFKNLKKLWLLKADYAEVIEVDGKNIVRGVPLENPYSYEYNTNGRLNKKKTISTVKVCSCR